MLDLSLGNWRIWYKKVRDTVYLVPSDTKVLENYLLKNMKILHDELLYDKAWIPTRAYMIFRLGKLPNIASCIALSFVKLCWPLWEVCHALKIKIMYTPPTYALLLHWGWHKNMPFHLDPPKKSFTPTLGVNTKNMFDRISTK